MGRVAPPKRKSGGGRTTPKGTRPGEQRYANPEEDERGVHSSTRYTPPVPESVKMPIAWIPYLMVALFVIGALLIVVKNLTDGSNWILLAGLACLMGGLFTATKWR